MSASSCMCACADRTEGQASLNVEEDSHTFHLPIKIAAIFSSKLLKRLHCDIKPATRAPLMPDASDGSVDEKHRVVSRLPTRRERTPGSLSWKEQFARLATDGVDIEVGKQSNAARHPGREGHIPSHARLPLTSTGSSSSASELNNSVAQPLGAFSHCAKC